MTRSYLIIPDLHYPFQDKRYIRLVTRVLERLAKSPGFEGMAQLGDAIDWFQLSTFDKDPNRLNDAFDDLCEYAGQLDEWEDLLPRGSEFRQLCGNHEDRMRRYIWQKAPHIRKMIRSLPDMLRFDERNRRHAKWRWFDYGNWRACKLGDVTLHHGFYFSMHTAHQILTKYHCKLVTGHTHRFDYRSNGDIWACTLGHGSNEDDTAHTPTKTGWHQAMGVIHIDKQGRGELEPVLVDSGRVIFRGEIISAS